MDREPELRADWLGVPHPARFAPDHADYDRCLRAHEQAVADGLDGYLDPSTGLYVMTATNLAMQGRCCDRGCRHCPFVGATVDERASSTPENEDPT